MIVTEADGTERRKSKVNDDDRVLAVLVLIETKFVNEPSILLVVQLFLWNQCQVTENVPKHAHEVADGNDNNDKLESLKEVGDHQDCHDVVVVEITIVGQLWFIINDFLQTGFEKILDVAHECVRRQKVVSLLDSNDLYQIEELCLRSRNEVNEGNLGNQINEKSSFQVPFAYLCEIFNCVVLIFRFVLKEELTDHIHQEDDLKSDIYVVSQRTFFRNSEGSEISIDV